MLAYFFTFTFSELSNFSKAFLNQVIYLESINKYSQQVFPGQIQHLNSLTFQSERRRIVQNAKFLKFTSCENYLETSI